MPFALTPCAQLRTQAHAQQAQLLAEGGLQQAAAQQAPATGAGAASFQASSSQRGSSAASASSPRGSAAQGGSAGGSSAGTLQLPLPNLPAHILSQHQEQQEQQGGRSPSASLRASDRGAAAVAAAAAAPGGSLGPAAGRTGTGSVPGMMPPGEGRSGGWALWPRACCQQEQQLSAAQPASMRLWRCFTPQLLSCRQSSCTSFRCQPGANQERRPEERSPLRQRACLEATGTNAPLPSHPRMQASAPAQARTAGALGTAPWTGAELRVDS